MSFLSLGCVKTMKLKCSDEIVFKSQLGVFFCGNLRLIAAFFWTNSKKCSLPSLLSCLQKVKTAWINLGLFSGDDKIFKTFKFFIFSYEKTHLIRKNPFWLFCQRSTRWQHSVELKVSFSLFVHPQKEKKTLSFVFCEKKGFGFGFSMGKKKDCKTFCFSNNRNFLKKCTKIHSN